MYKVLILILLMAVSAYATDWTENKGKREWHAQKTKVVVSHQLEMIGWPGLTDSTYFRVDVGSITDSIWYNGDTTTIGISEYFHARFYNIEYNAIEWEAVLYQKPGNQYSWTFPIEHNNLTFHYQPELTQEEIDGGSYRPDSVVGSYAVYHAYKVNNEYATGKAFHIYRPKAWDSAGDTVWLDIQIDTITNNLTINGTQQWFRDAVYPVMIDPTFGISGVGGTQYSDFETNCFANYLAVHKYTAMAADTIISYHFYGSVASGTETIDMAAYESPSGDGYPTDRLAVAQSITITDTPGWRTSSAVTDALTDETTYVVAVGDPSGDVTGYYDAVTDAGAFFAGNLDAVWPGASKTVTLFSMYATFRSGGYYTGHVDYTNNDVAATFSSDEIFDLTALFGWFGDHVSVDTVSGPSRFTDVNIAQGTTIDSAFLMVYLTEKIGGTATPGDDVAMYIIGQDADDADTFSTHEDYFVTRSYTSAIIEHTVPGNTTVSAWYTFPDIKTIIQEIVDRGSWASGNAMVIDPRGNDGNSGDHFKFASFEHTPGGTMLTPRLTIYYTVGAPPEAELTRRRREERRR